MIGPAGSHNISSGARSALFDRSSIESIVDENRAQRPLNQEETARVDTLSRLQFFLATAPTRWGSPSTDSAPSLHKFHLPTGESVSCVLWQGLFHITGTDIVRALAFRFEAFGRPIKSSKKWEEGVFSDLRNLKPGADAALEEPKSPLLEFLFRNGCIRTQKKQKVFYWFSVPHDRLFLDALERDLKREKAGLEPTSIVVGEPAMSFRYDPKRTLYEQFAGQNPGILSNNASPVVVSAQSITTSHSAGIYSNFSDRSTLHTIIADTHSQMDAQSNHKIAGQPLIRVLEDDPRIFKQSILPGSSDYKRRRSGSRRASSLLRALERTSVVRTRPDPEIPRAWTSSPQLLSVVPSLSDHPYGLPPALPVAAQFSLSSDSRFSPALDLMQSQGLQHLTSNMVTVSPLADQYLSNGNVDKGLKGLANPHIVPGSSVPLPSESASEAAFDALSTFTSFS
ncbi:hypothetical protein V865_006099 [Kwoniella europaea PYCC6329]|uniref:STE12 n=1 Tax=Kwoniella europaea PYCC6329 TaxID=1423913 RepID=A0AAX4KPW2_9TREE